MITYGKCDEKRVYDIAASLCAVGIITKDDVTKTYTMYKPMETCIDIDNISVLCENMNSLLQKEQDDLRRLVDQYMLLVAQDASSNSSTNVTPS